MHGTKNDIIAVDTEALLAEFTKVKFQTTTYKSTYNPELLTQTYVGSLFDALRDIETFWIKCTNQVGKYVENFENIPLPETMEDDSGFLDDDNSTNKTIQMSNPNSALNFRSSPNSQNSSNIITSIANGSEVKVVEPDNGDGWTKISYNGQEGWVSSDYLSE